MTAAARFAKRRKCLGCPKWLTNEVSQLRGRGPTCWRRWRVANGWSMGERRVRVRRPMRTKVEQPVLDGLEDEINESER